jgi:hypothetical protein
MTKSYIDVKRRMWGVAALFAAAGLLAMPSLASAQPKEGQQDEVFQKTRDVAIPGGALVSFDISWFDGDLNRYYLGDRSNVSVDVIDPPSKVTQFKPGFVGFTGNNDTSGPDGVLTLLNKGKKELWVGDGMSRVWVLDATATTTVLVNTGSAANPIPTSSGPTITIPNNPHRADELCWDSADKLVMIANNADDPPFATIISTDTYTVKAQIAFDGTNNAPKSNNGAEQCAWSPRTGLFYISIPGIEGLPDGEGGVAVIDPKTMKVINTFIIRVADCAAPQGMAVGPAPQIFLGCNQPSPNGQSNTVVINEKTGSVIGKLRDQGGNDEVWFNPGDGHYFGGGGQTFPTERLIVVDSTGKRADQSVPTGLNCGTPPTTRRAHSVAADPNTNEVYVPIPANTLGAPSPPPTSCPTTGQFFTSNLCTDPTKGCVSVFEPIGTNDMSSSILRSSVRRNGH